MSALFSCREAARLLSERQDRPLVLRERMSLCAHQAMCGACRAYARQIRLIDATFIHRGQKTEDPLPPSEALSTAARERIRAALQQRTATPAVGQPVLPPPAAPVWERGPNQDGRPGRTWPRGAARGSRVALVLLLLAAVAGGGYWYYEFEHCPPIRGRSQIAAHIATHHRGQDRIEFTGASLAELAQAMSRLDFTPQLPQQLHASAIRIEGARYCAAGEHVAMHVFVNIDGVRKTLYLARAIAEVPAELGLVRLEQDGVAVQMWREQDQFCGLAEDATGSRP